MSLQDFDIMSFSSQINTELNQFITLAELLRQMDDPAESREGFFMGLADMIECGSDRIKEIIEPLYEVCHKTGVGWPSRQPPVKVKKAE